MLHRCQISKHWGINGVTWYLMSSFYRVACMSMQSHLALTFPKMCTLNVLKLLTFYSFIAKRVCFSCVSFTKYMVICEPCRTQSGCSLAAVWSRSALFAYAILSNTFTTFTVTWYLVLDFFMEFHACPCMAVQSDLSCSSSSKWVDKRKWK